MLQPRCARCAFWAVLGRDEGMEAHIFPQQESLADFVSEGEQAGATLQQLLLWCW